MAKTTFSTSDALTKKVWEEKLFRDMVKESYFSRFMGSGPNSLVQTKTQLEKSQGDKVTFGIRMRLTGAGITSGSILEGNEEKLSTYSDDVTLEQYRHGVRDDGALSRQRAVFSIDDEAEQALKDWGSEKIDSLCFDAINASPTKILYPDAAAGNFKVGTVPATVISDMDASSLITPTFISQVKCWAKTGGSRAIVPLRPVKVEGSEYYILLCHPDVLYTLKVDTTFTQAMREAQERGKDNPLFKHATAIWDGVVIHEHENMPIGGSTTGVGTWGKCVLMGAQSLVWAWGERPKLVQKNFDYENEHGYAWGMICGVNKPVFNSLDYGSVAVYCIRKAISDL